MKSTVHEGNLFQVVDCSPTIRFSTSPCQSHPWGDQGSQGNPEGLDDGAAWRGPRGPRGGVTLRSPRSGSPEARPASSSRAEACGLEPVGPRRDPVVRTALLPPATTQPPPGHPNPSTGHLAASRGEVPLLRGERGVSRWSSQRPWLTLNGARKSLDGTCGRHHRCARDKQSGPRGQHRHLLAPPRKLGEKHTAGKR